MAPKKRAATQQRKAGTSHGELPGKVRQDLSRQVGDVVTYSATLVSQGEHKFYILTMPSKILALAARAAKRDEDPVNGYQRELDKRRAQEIADYVDNGGVIPNSIVLSAQDEANFSYSNSTRSVTFTVHPGAFFILDGQHRAWGFHLAKSTVSRAPVVMFAGLSLSEECQLFIDINTKQRPVPNELLLDIKKLADIETDDEGFKGEVFDLFLNSTGSPLAGLLSSASKESGRVSRVTFYAAMSAAKNAFKTLDPRLVYESMAPYYRAVIDGLKEAKAEKLFVQATVFRAFAELFQDAAQRARGSNKTPDFTTYKDVLRPLFDGLKARHLEKGNVKDKAQMLRDRLFRGFKIE